MSSSNCCFLTCIQISQEAGQVVWYSHLFKMLCKPLTQFSVDGRGCVPSLLFDLRPNSGGGNEENGDLLQKVPCAHCLTPCLRPCRGHCQLTAPPGTPGHSQPSLGQSLGGVTAPFFWVLVHTGFCLCLQKSVSPVVCKFCGLCGGVNGDLLQEGLCHTQVCCTQSPCPCGRPLLTCTSTKDVQTLKDKSGSVSVGSPDVHKVLFEPSEHLLQVWGLILNAILTLLPSGWGFSFALVHGVSFFGGVQHSPVDGCSAMSYYFGVLTGEDEHMSFYPTILICWQAMTNLNSISKSRDITLLTKVHIVKAMVFPVVMYGCDSWTIKKAECLRIDAFELCCWRRLLRVPWTARRSN